MVWPVDKLILVNQALSLTGDNEVAVADDGSDEWRVAGTAYDTSIEPMLEAHNWPWATIVAQLARTGVPSDALFTDAYRKPDDCAHLIWVRLSGIPVAYQVLNNQIVLTSSGQPVTIKYVSSANQNPANAQVSRLFVASLLAFVMAGIYRGLHEDMVSSREREQVGHVLLDQAKVRADQEQPKRAFFNSRLGMSRRVRRPWPSTPSGWGGPGIPG